MGLWELWSIKLNPGIISLMNSSDETDVSSGSQNKFWRCVMVKKVILVLWCLILLSPGMVLGQEDKDMDENYIYSPEKFMAEVSFFAGGRFKEFEMFRTSDNERFIPCVH